MSEKASILSIRLGEILTKMNSGMVVSVKKLSQDFNVTERTIQKDLNERIDSSIIESLGHGQYRLIPGYLGNLTQKDIKEFSELSGIIDLYPDLDDIIRNKIRDSLIVNPTINKACIPNANDFKEINYVIIHSLQLKFNYNNKNVVVKPYKLLNDNGIWYLLAKNNNKIKSYCIHKMKKVRRDIKNFVVDAKLLNDIELNPSPWFKKNKINVELRVVPELAEYFLDRNIISNSKLSEIQKDKSLKIIISVNSIEEIKGTIKYWLPNIDVIEPLFLKEEIKKEIRTYLVN